MTQKLKQIDLFKNSRGQYEMLVNCTNEFEKALHRQEIQSNTYDTEEKTLSEISAQFVKNPPDCTAGFNFFMTAQSMPTRIPHLAMMVDSATYYPELIQAQHVIAAMSDQDSVEFLKLFGKKHALFFPLATDQETVSEKKNDEILNSKRDLAVVFAGSFVDGALIFSRWKDYFSKDLLKLFDNIVEETLASSTRSHIIAVFEAFQANPKFAQEIKEKEFGFLDIINSIEQVMRGRDKERLLNALHDQQIQMFVPEQEKALWQKVLKQKNNLVFHPPVSFQDLFSVFKRSKIVINSMPQIKRGFHEQMLLALGAGASSLTNENVLLSNTFKPGSELLYYLAPNYEKVTTKIQSALTNESKRLDDVMQARDVIRKAHTWDARVKMLQENLPQLLQEMKGQK
jgi:hypothetical protein